MTAQPSTTWHVADYPRIADHGLIGDLQTAALVSTGGVIDWFCSPRFDSPSVFGALLDAANGGYCCIRPAVEVSETKQLYFPDTAILITRFMTEAGVGELVDFMPVKTGAAVTSHQLVRIVRCVRGQMTFEIDVAPRFDYGRLAHTIDVTQHGAVFSAPGISLTLASRYWTQLCCAWPASASSPLRTRCGCPP
jgi:GH15 family glucan-1,4-alpha-glucosidase